MSGKDIPSLRSRDITTDLHLWQLLRYNGAAESCLEGYCRVIKTSPYESLVPRRAIDSFLAIEPSN
jgi:hypothetical protein